MLQGLREAEYELAFFTESARTYWRMWGLLGDPVIGNLESWAGMQQAYFQWVWEASGAGERR